MSGALTLRASGRPGANVDALQECLGEGTHADLRAASDAGVGEVRCRILQPAVDEKGASLERHSKTHQTLLQKM